MGIVTQRLLWLFGMVWYIGILVYYLVYYLNQEKCVHLHSAKVKKKHEKGKRKGCSLVKEGHKFTSNNRIFSGPSLQTNHLQVCTHKLALSYRVQWSRAVSHVKTFNPERASARRLEIQDWHVWSSQIHYRFATCARWTLLLQFWDYLRVNEWSQNSVTLVQSPM